MDTSTVMYRGTTPTNTFNVTVDLTEATEIFITYAQSGKTPTSPLVNLFERSLPNITVSATQLVIKLTQEETLKFSPGEAYVQIRAKFSDGTTVASKIISTTAERILKDGVI